MKRSSNFKQSSKVGTAGSFVNQLIGNNNSLPVVGKGATELHYSDRTCYEVVEVSKDLKTVKLEYLEAKADQTKPLGVGHQNWILEPTGQFVTVVWRNNAWKTKVKVVRFTKAFIAKAEAEQVGKYVMYTNSLTEEQRWAVYNGEAHPKNVVEGITEEAYEYHKIKLLFGSKSYYYDWSF